MKSIMYFASSLFCLSAQYALADVAVEEETSSPAPLPPSVAYKPEAVTTEPRGLITPTVSPRVDKGQEIDIDADFIWWKTYISDFDYAQIDGKVLSPKAVFEPGFKVGTGMDLYHDGWDVYTQYTWVHQPKIRNSGTAVEPGYSTFVVPYAQGANLGTLSAISIFDTSAWRSYKVNILDAEVGRNFFISKRLTLRPHVGIKGASLFEETKIIYTGEGPVDTATVRLKQNLSGLGIRGGIDTVWHIIPSFGFYGDFAFTALWGNFHNRLTSHVVLDGSSESHPLRKNSQDIVPVLEAGFGLTYMVWFKQNRYQLYTKAGWEEQIWIGYNKNLINGQTSADGSLTMQGLTWKVGFVF